MLTNKDWQRASCLPQSLRAINSGISGVSWLRISGADIQTVAQLLGQKDLRMAARYQHLSSSFLTEAVGKLDSVFEAVRYQDVTAQNLLTEGESVSC
jgi:hypothetical protein